MRSGWTTVPVERFATQRVEPVALRDDETYINLGVKWYAQGTFQRDPKLGAEIKAPRLYRGRPGQFIYNRMFATEGSFALVRPGDERAVASNEFPVFDLDESQILGQYLALYFQQPAVWRQVSQECVGTTKSRLRWKEERFLKHLMLIPPVAQQERIVDLIAALDETIITADVASAAAGAHLTALRTKIFIRGEKRSASEVFDILIGLQRSPARAKGDHQTQYLRSANVLAGSLDLSDVKTMSFTPQQQEKYRLVDGDVLVSEGSASATAVGAPSDWRDELPGTVCFQNTLLRFRSVPEMATPEFTSQWCSWAYESGAFREAANGTNIKHIGAGGASRMKVGWVPVDEQATHTKPLEAGQRVVESVRATAEALRTLRNNLLNALLSGAHPIPETYDATTEEAL